VEQDQRHSLLNLDASHAARLEQLKSTFEMAPFGTCLMHRSGLVLYTNPRFAAVVDIRPLEGRSIYDLITEVLQDESLKDRLNNLIEADKPFSLMIETLSSPKLRTSGFVNIYGYRIDEFIVLVADLVGGGDRYTRLVQEALDAIVILKKGMITYANRSFADLLGLVPETLVGRRFLEFVDERDHAPLTALSQDQVRELSLQVDIHTPAGMRVLDGRFHTIKDRPDTVIAFLRDITEDVALEKRLLRQNQDLAVINLISEILSSSLQLRQVLEMTLSKVLQVMNIETGWIFLLNEREQLLRVAHAHGLAADVINSIGELRLGEGIAGQVAMSGEPLIIEDATADYRFNSPALQQLGLRSFASIPLKSRKRMIGVMNMGSFGQRTLSGEDKRLLLNIGLHMGTVIENVLLFEEIASKSDELKKALNVIEQRNEELRNLVDTVSHDLKNPIIAINGFSARLLKSASSKLTGRETEYVQAIQESGRNMERFVSDLLSVSAAERVKVESGEIELVHLLAEVVRDLTPQLEEKDGVIEISHNLPVVVADTTRLMQVFSNLISNAIKYAHPERRPHIRIFCAKEGDRHIFYVSDNGLGIPGEFRDSVFDIFFRTHADIAEGSGVGLSIVKRAITAMGGEIWIEPGTEVGTTFVFTIPIKKFD